MDFMSYAFEGSGLELAADMNERNLKSFSHQIDQTHVTRHPNHEGAQFMEFSLGDMLQNSPLCDPRVSSGDQIDNDFAEMVLSHHHHHHHPVTESWLPRDAISCHGWKTSSFNLVSDINFESGLKVHDDRNKKVKSGEDSKENLDLSSGEGAEASAKVKRARITNLGSQAPICQVHGCLKDLSSSKDYYRRHRVCNEHSKTTKVVVDGIEQRFCQQCSRFHLLSEFDDDKRSCRKSLAGHNERRRKPQFDTHHGPRFFDMNLQTEQFFLPELLPVNYFIQERYELENNISRSIKMDNDEKHISFSKLVPPKSSTLHAMQKGDQSKNNIHFGKMVQELSTGEINSISDHWDFGKIEESSDGKEAGVYYEGEIYESFQCAENGETIDLEQLSTKLQRVEQQRNSAQLKQESGNNLFYCFTSG